MGCSASTPAVMETPKEQRNSLSAASRKDFECANAGNDGENEQRKNDDHNNKSYPASEAFVIPLDDDAAKSYTPGAAVPPMVSKKPPKRIQELMQQAEKAESPANLQELEKKLNEAELRRKDYLQQKIENIQKTTQTLMRASETGTAPELEQESKDSATYANEIKAKALDDDSKHELLSSTWKS